MTPEQAREKYTELYGAVTDEEWAEIAADVTDWDKFFEDKSATEGDGEEPETEEDDTKDEVPEAVTAALAAANEQIASMQATIGSLTDQMAQATTVMASLQSAMVEQSADAKKLSAATEIRASLAGMGDGTEKVAESSVAVLAALSANPGPDTIGALLDHLKINGGKLCTIPVGQINASLDSAKPGSLEGKLVELGRTDPDTEKAIRGLAARRSISLDDAWAEHFRSLSGL